MLSRQRLLRPVATSLLSLRHLSCGRKTPPGRAFGRSPPCFLAPAYDRFAALSTALRLLAILRSEGCSTLSFAWYVVERVIAQVGRVRVEHRFTACLE
eukprot:scaffold69026_cov78-Phaeocystis_antarctica.AAC.6